jgi:hypothetical protein
MNGTVLLNRQKKIPLAVDFAVELKARILGGLN